MTLYLTDTLGLGDPPVVDRDVGLSHRVASLRGGPVAGHPPALGQYIISLLTPVTKNCFYT